jgi:hypothetical protein
MAAIGAVVLAGCDETARTTTTVARVGPTQVAKLKAFAFRETRLQARRTCAAVPRMVLTRAFARRSEDPPFGDDVASYDNNAIALLYVEDIAISPIRLQSAAYEGCTAGLD